MNRCQLHKFSRLLDISKPNGECKKKKERITFAVRNLAPITLTIEFKV